MDSAVVTYRNAVLATSNVAKQVEAAGGEPNTVAFLETVRRARKENARLDEYLATLEADTIRILEAEGIPTDMVRLTR